MEIFGDKPVDLMEHSVHLVQSVTPDGAFVYVNPAWQQIFGYEEEGLAQLSVFDMVHPDYQTEFLRMFEQVKGGEKITRFETVLLAANERSVAIEGSCNCTFENGIPRTILIVGQDVTERKRAEDVLARQAADLLKAHEILEERDRELADTLEQARKYREAQERARELAVINEELKAEIERRVEAEVRITASLQEKEVLLKEIHHRVKNNLQIISSLLNLQSGYIDDSQTLEMFRESQSRIQSMALIHEKLYQSEDLARVDFAEYVQNLVSFLMRSYGRGAGVVDTEIDVAPVFLNLDTSIPCGLIISELMTNALKYAFPQGRGGKVYVRLQPQEEGMYTLVVGDDGVGFPEDIDFMDTESLGLQLVTTLTDQLDGTIELDRSAGTEFRIVFRTQKSGHMP